MKKQFLSILSLLVISMLTNAQDITSYRGAFAPAPVPMWTDSWTNWDPQNTAYPASNVTISGSIASNTTWTSNNVYLLQGVVYIDSLITLTIQPGTVILGDNTIPNSSLLVRRGAKLMAEGTVCSPIVFTSNKAPGSRLIGDWGGVIVLGRAKNNSPSGIVLIEGLSAADSRHYHGGTDDDDNSGIIKYVRIEWGGYVFAPNSEINALTMGSVGRNTIIDYVQTSYNNDDAFEWFGGNVNAKHLVSYRNLDDDFDADFGYSGIVQYGLSIKDPAVSDNPAVSTSEGFEADNDPAGTNEALLPKTSAKFYNITQIGAFRCSSNTSGTGVAPTASGFRRGLRLRRNVDLKVVNSIFMNNRRGLFIDGALALANIDQDSLVFRNNIIAADFTTNFTSPSGNGLALAAEDVSTRTRLFNLAYQNDSLNTCSLLTNAWNFLSPDYRPNTAGAGAIVINPASLNTGADLSPVVQIDNTLFTANQSTDFLVGALENGGGATNGIITITIPKLSGWNITVPGLTLTGVNQSGTNGTSNVGGGTANNNGNWNFRDDGTNIIATSKPGVVIAKSDFSQVGFVATRKGTTSNGTNQNLGVFISGGGDNSPANNTAVTGFSAN